MDEWLCPSCGEELEPIGCEKTIVCDECGAEWKYGDGMESLVPVEHHDPVFFDR